MLLFQAWNLRHWVKTGLLFEGYENQGGMSFWIKGSLRCSAK